MSNSLQRHGIKEIYKQLRLRMKNSGLETIEVHVTRRAGKYKYNFTGSAEQVVQAEKILAAWGLTLRLIPLAASPRRRVPSAVVSGQPGK